MLPEPSKQALRMTHLQFGYRTNKPILAIDDLTIGYGERVFLFGPSGSGKTTLLGIMTGILQPQAGSIYMLGRHLNDLSVSERDTLRGAHIGYIFQMFNLIPYLSVGENIMLPCLLNPSRAARVQNPADAYSPRHAIRSAAHMLADRLGIAAHFDDPVTNLSVGQQQRVAAARALLGQPELLIADEPTSALDTDQRENFVKLLFEISDLSNTTIVFVSHDPFLRSLFKRSIALLEINRAPSGGNRGDASR